MPIDLAAVAARFAAAFAAQLLSATTAQKSLDKALTKRRDADRLVERASSRFPIVQFIDGAVTLRLTPAQRHVLSLDQPMSFGQQLAAGGHDFVAGVAKAAGPFRADSQETAIPRMLAGLDRMLADIEEPIRRFSTPSTAMFRPDDRTAADLFGLAALAVKVLAAASAPTGSLWEFTFDVADALWIVNPPAAVTDAAATAARSLPDTLDAVAYELTAALVVVGTLPEFVTTLLTGVDLRLRQTVLDELGGLEAEVLAFRRDAFETMFAGLTALAGDGVRYAVAARTVLLANLVFQMNLWQRFGTELALGLRDFVIHLGDSLAAVVKLLETVPKVLSVITGFKLIRFKTDSVILGFLLDFRLDDLLNPAGTGVNAELRTLLNDLIDGFEDKILKSKLGRLAGVFSDTVKRARRSVPRARRLVAALFDSGGPDDTIPVLPEAPPLVFRSDFPALGDTFFSTSTALGLSTGVGGIFGAVRSTVDRAAERVAGGLGEMSDAFAADSARAARLQAGRGLLRTGTQADTLAAGLFGPELVQARGPADLAAEAFEKWFADGGMILIGTLIDGYVAELARYWRAQLGTGSELTAPVTPTSPHILRRRARLGRVVVPRMRLRAPAGAPLDERLAEVLARRFAEAVAEAYRTGEQRLADMAAAGGK